MATSSSSTSSSSRLGSASPSTSVICQEVFDESCQPSEEGKFLFSSSIKGLRLWKLKIHIYFQK